jgi:hypothetical protein
MITLSSYNAIDPDECIGDSLTTINESFIELFNRTYNLSILSSMTAIDSMTVHLNRNLITNTLSADVISRSIKNNHIAFDGGAFSFRNFLLNGAMSIDQRNCGTPFVVPTHPTNIARLYTVDRWFCECSPQTPSTAAVVNVFRDTDAPKGFTNSVTVSVDATQLNAGSFPEDFTKSSISQVIEMKDAIRFKYGTQEAQTITLTFNVKTSVVGRYTGQLKVKTNQIATPYRSYIFNYETTTNDWETKTITISGDKNPLSLISSSSIASNGNTEGVTVSFNIGTGNDYGVATSNLTNTWIDGDYITVKNSPTIIPLIKQAPGSTLKFTGVQLELGDCNTPYEHKPETVELQLCQRYYEKSYSKERKAGDVLQNTSGGAGFIDNLEDGEVFAKNPGNPNEFNITQKYQTEKRDNPVVTTYNPFNGTPSQSLIRDSSVVSVLASVVNSGVITSVLPKRSNVKKCVIQVDQTALAGSPASLISLVHWVADSEIY